MFWVQLINFATKLSSSKAHYYNGILNELSINSTSVNPTYTPTALSKDEILQNHRSVFDTSNIKVNGINAFELPYIYWIPNLHQNPYKHRYISGSSKCSTKPISLHRYVKACFGNFAEDKICKTT
jgi:hypothetical protein